MPVTEQEMTALVGHRFPGAEITIAHWENVLLCDVMETAPDPGGTAHPAFLFHLSLHGAGMSVADLLELGKAENEERVRAGEYVWQLHQPLRVGVPYAVSGGVTSVVRKEGRRAGLMDALTFRVEFADQATGAPVATTDTTCLFLRSA